MLGVLCARPKPWLFASLCLSHAPPLGYSRVITSTSSTNRLIVGGGDAGAGGGDQRRVVHSSHCRINRCGGAASIWHAILPAVGRRNKKDANTVFKQHHYELAKKGEGSWNVTWDSRPARWLHNPDSAWLLFGVCSCLAAPALGSCLAAPVPAPAPSLDLLDSNCDVALAVDNKSVVNSDEGDQNSANYRVTGVPADGRCLFRAIAHMACLRNGEEAPDENRQRELADELRAQVVDELLKRRKEAEWFIEGDFDAYVERIEKPYVWGGEPELLMASHVLKTSISVYMVDRSSGSLINISNYGEEYRKEGESPINLLFHGYGHYDILESISENVQQKLQE